MKTDQFFGDENSRKEAAKKNEEKTLLLVFVVGYGNFVFVVPVVASRRKYSVSKDTKTHLRKKGMLHCTER